MQLNLSIPEYLQPLIRADKQVTVIFAAPMTGALETILMLMARAGGGLYVGPGAKDVKQRFEQFFQLYPRARLPEMHFYETFDGITADYKNAVINEPRDDCEAWINLHISGQSWVVNPEYKTFADADVKIPITVLPAAHIKRIKGTIKNDFEWRAKYMLQDPDDIQMTSFLRFARTRLYIRTDKPKDQLTKYQLNRIKSGDEGALIVPFDVSELQRKYLAIKRAAKRRGYKKFLLLKYRRGGFTTIEQGLSYQLTACRRHAQVVTLAHTSESTRRIFRIAKKYHEEDPSAPTLKGVGNATTLEFPEVDSLFFIGTAGSTGFGRGDTLQRVHGSEVSKWCPGPHQYDKVTDLIAGLTEAASHGEVVLETTPYGHEWFAQTYKEAKKGLNDWFPIFLPWFADPRNTTTEFNKEQLLDTITAKEQDLITKHKLSLGQIAFRRMKVKALKKLFPQEYPEDDISCFITSGMPFFDPDKVIELLETLPHYDTKNVKGGYVVYWEEPKPDTQYVMGGDTSEGLAHGDLNGFGVLERDTGRQVASLHGRFNFDQLAEWGLRLSKKYNDALIGCERNNHGHAVLQRMIDKGAKSHLKGGCLYYFHKDKPGWDTNGQTRPVMIDELAEAVEDDLMTVRDRDFLDECLTFKKQSNGKYEADQTCHDDTVMKWAIAWQMRKVRRKRSRFIQVDM